MRGEERSGSRRAKDDVALYILVVYVQNVPERTSRGFDLWATVLVPVEYYRYYVEKLFHGNSTLL